MDPVPVSTRYSGIWARAAVLVLTADPPARKGSCSCLDSGTAFPRTPEQDPDLGKLTLLPEPLLQSPADCAQHVNELLRFLASGISDHRRVVLFADTTMFQR
jgi:hypothetical protein